MHFPYSGIQREHFRLLAFVETGTHFSHLSEVRSKSKQGNAFQGTHRKISLTPFWSFTGRSFLVTELAMQACRRLPSPLFFFLLLICTEASVLPAAWMIVLFKTSKLDQRKLKVTSPGQTTQINPRWQRQKPLIEKKTRQCLYENKGVHLKLLSPFIAMFFSLFLSNEYKASRVKWKLNYNTTGVEAKRVSNPSLGL